MKVHELKTWPEPFEAIWYDMKTAEIRKNDRAFSVGDILRLEEWDPDPDEQTYTGRVIVAEITHIERGFGVPEGYAMLSIRVHEKHDG
jgi:hypothetical protein